MLKPLCGSSHYKRCLQEHILLWWHTHKHTHTHTLTHTLTPLYGQPSTSPWQKKEKKKNLLACHNVKWTTAHQSDTFPMGSSAWSLLRFTQANYMLFISRGRCDGRSRLSVNTKSNRQPLEADQRMNSKGFGHPVTFSSGAANRSLFPVIQ